MNFKSMQPNKVWKTCLLYSEILTQIYFFEQLLNKNDYYTIKVWGDNQGPFGPPLLVKGLNNATWPQSDSGIFWKR